jgi:putative chitinase
VLHESGGLTLDRESMKYRAGRLVEIFGEGRHSAAITRTEAERLALDERAIAERVYGLGNPRKAEELGNRQTGDGFRYRGCGLMQTTGRANYRRIGQLCGVDFEQNPDLVCSPEHALKPALAEWSEAGLNIFADNNDILAISRAINCGSPKSKKVPNGMQDRATWFAKVRQLVDDVEFKSNSATAEKALTPQVTGALSHPKFVSESLSNLLGGRILRTGDDGPIVRALQLALRQLGYDLRGSGNFAGATLIAVQDFQQTHDLEVDGEVGAETANAVDLALEQLRPENVLPTHGIAALIGGRILRIGDSGNIVRTAQLAHYNGSRTHRALHHDAPVHRPVQSIGAITSRPVLGGLHHQYCRT